MVQLMHKEQYDFKNNVEAHIYKVGDAYTICLHQTSTNLWRHSNIPFDTLIDAHKAFEVIMCKAPIQKELKIVNSELIN